jgi:hypothetical protein
MDEAIPRMGDRGAAVALAAIAGPLVLREVGKPHLARWQKNTLNQVAGLVKGNSKFDAQSRNPAELVARLQVNGAPTAQTLPRNLERLESLGCKTFSSEGQPISVICFQRADGGLIHLAVTKASPVLDRTLTGQPKFIQQGNWATATWQDGGTVYMLALEGPVAHLRSYLL